jgi:programmed cell death 6-interacting protein
VPSSTVGSSSNSQSLQTRQHARALRAKLEQLDALHHGRDQLIHQAQNLEAADDIQPRVVKVASGFERLIEIRADMFEDILDEELAKYDRFLTAMGDLQQREEILLADIKV